MSWSLFWTLMSAWWMVETGWLMRTMLPRYLDSIGNFRGWTGLARMFRDLCYGFAYTLACLLISLLMMAVHFLRLLRWFLTAGR